LRKVQMGHDADCLKEEVQALSQAIMEMEIEDHIGASRHELVEARSGLLSRTSQPPARSSKSYRGPD
jgi:hypothetical protein